MKRNVELALMLNACKYAAMKSGVDKVLGVLLLPLALLLIMKRKNICLAYHKIAENYDIAYSDIAIKPTTFKLQMKVLRYLGYQFVTKFNSLENAQCVITFDDGYLSTLSFLNQEDWSKLNLIHFISGSMSNMEYEPWAQYLRKKIYKKYDRKYGLNLITTLRCEWHFWYARQKVIRFPQAKRVLFAKLAKKGLHNYDLEKSFASHDQLKRFISSAHLVGSHSYHHASFNLMNLEEIQADTKKNNEFIEKLGVQYNNTLALPYGSEVSDEEVTKYLSDSFDYIYLTRSKLTDGDQSQMLPRSCISEKDGILLFLIKISGVLSVFRT